jgi:uncharacterized membrane protein
MISFPLSLFLIPYAIFLLVIAFFAFVNVRNLARYRAEDIISFMAVFIFIAGLAVIAYFSYEFLSEIDWTKTIEISLPTLKTSF